MNWQTVFWVITIAALWAVNHLLEERRHKREGAEQERVFAGYERYIDHQYEEIKDLRDRLFQSKAMAPSGVDLTEIYEERKKNEREHKERTGGKLPPGPLERLAEKWKDKDLKAAQEGVDYTSDKHSAN